MNTLFVEPSTEKQIKLREKFQVLQEEEDLENQKFTVNNSVELFSDIYEICGLIGSGGFGLVLAGFEKSSSNLCAIKVIRKHLYDEKGVEKIRCESKILSSLQHKNIVEFYKMHESERLLIVVMELLQGGSLRQFLRLKAHNNENFSENDVVQIMKQLLTGIHYIHSKNIIHRDIKPENILFKTKNNLSSLRIADFGLAIKIEENEEIYTCTQDGTYMFMSPEQIHGKNINKLSDIWSCGVIMYMLLCKQHPFYKINDSKEQVKKRMLRGLSFPNGISNIAKDLIQKMCRYDKNDRYSAYDALNHPFVTRDINGKIPLTLKEEIELMENNIDLMKVTNLLIFISKLIIETRNAHKINREISKSPKISTSNISEELISETSPKSNSYFKNYPNARNNHFKINLQTNIGYSIKKKVIVNDKKENNHSKDNCLISTKMNKEIIFQSPKIINPKGNSNSPNCRNNLNNLNNLKSKEENFSYLKSSLKLKTCPSETNILHLIESSSYFKNSPAHEVIPSSHKRFNRKGTTIHNLDKITNGINEELKLALNYDNKIPVLQHKRRTMNLNPIPNKKTSSPIFPSYHPVIKIPSKNRIIIK